MDKKEISKIYNETLDMVFRYVYSRVGNKELTEDIVTDTYVTFMEIVDRYDGSSKVETFIIGIARNKIHKAWDKDNLKKYVDIDLDCIVIEEDDESEEIYEKKTQILLEHMEKVLKKLPNKYKRIIELRFKEMMTTEEISESMDISKGNVRVLQHRALSKAAVIANKLNISIS